VNSAGIHDDLNHTYRRFSQSSPTNKEDLFSRTRFPEALTGPTTELVMHGHAVFP
jgi:hypothetical protein